MAIRIRNWSKHQHFKDRMPPWIKLYRDILDDPYWHELDGDTAKVLIGLWLVASEDETKTGTLPGIKKLAFRLRITEKQLNQALTKLSSWLIHDDIEVISDRYQVDAPETETETEQRQKAVSAKRASRSNGLSVDDLVQEGIDRQHADDWLKIRKAKRAPLTLTAWQSVKLEAEKAGVSPAEAVGICAANAWQGFKASWLERPLNGSSSKNSRASIFDGVDN